MKNENVTIGNRDYKILSSSQEFILLCSKGQTKPTQQESLNTLWDYLGLKEVTQ